MKKIFALLLSGLFLFSTVACSTEAPSTNAIASNNSSQIESTSSEGDTFTFTDDAGREVTLPTNIERIAPSGSMTQIVLYTLCPDKMVGWSSEFSEIQRKYMDSKYADLPVFGNFYGDTLNLESLMIAQPQVIFDIGEAKSTGKEDLDALQEKTGIPTVFIKMEMDSTSSAYETLGKLIGEESRAEQISQYVSTTLTETAEKLEQIPEAERKTVYYGRDEGLTALVAGTVHSEVIEYAGGINVSTIEKSLRGGASQISMEQLLLWNPDVILVDPDTIYDDLSSKAEWQTLSAITNGNYYEVPNGPYNWMGSPPSVNRVLGVKWLSNLLYPDIFDYDMIKETQEFYELFYHSTISEEDAQALLANSTYKMV